MPFGVELVWRGLQFGHDRGLTRLTQASVTRLPYPDASIDVVLSFDVLYCLHDPDEQAAIAEMFRVLRPGRSLIVNVAALDMLKGDHSALTREVRRYTKRGLRDKLERAGFRVKRITYTNASLFPVTAVVRALQRLRGMKSEEGNEGDFYLPPEPINALFSGGARGRVEADCGGHRHARRKFRYCVWPANPSKTPMLFSPSMSKIRKPSVRRSGLPDRSLGTKVLSVSMVIMPSAAARAAAGTFTVRLKSADGCAVASTWLPARTVTFGAPSKYRSGDSPARVSVTSRPPEFTNVSARPVIHHQRRCI